MNATEEDKSFSKRHPRVNALFGMIFLAAICLGTVLLIRYVCIGIKSGILQVWYTLSKMDVVVIVAIITGGFSIIAVCTSTIIGKFIEAKQTKREYLTKKREKPYEDFVEMIYKLQMSTKLNHAYEENELIVDISKVSKQITLWGSSKVVNKWVRFRENASNSAKGKNKDYAINNLFVLEEIMNDMRRDLGVKKVKKGNLLAFFVNDIKEILNNNS